jgi:hypothetical protein
VGDGEVTFTIMGTNPQAVILEGALTAKRVRAYTTDGKRK